MKPVLRTLSVPLCVLAITVIFVSSPQLVAHSGASGIIKERMDAMKTMGDHARDTSKMFNGKKPFNSEKLRTTAIVFSQHAADIVSLFPDTHESRHGKKTEALEAIWDNWPKFTELARAMLDSSDSLLAQIDATADRSILKDAYFDAVAHCKSCHKKFRKAKKK